jgi:hypothetical protein
LSSRTLTPTLSRRERENGGMAIGVLSLGRGWEVRGFRRAVDEQIAPDARNAKDSVRGAIGSLT